MINLVLNRMAYPILKAGSASDVTKKVQGRVEYGNILGQEMAVAAGILPRVTLQKGGGGSSSSRTASLVGATLLTPTEVTTAVTTLVSNISINPRTAAVLSAAALSKYGITSVPGAVAAAPTAPITLTVPGAPTLGVITSSYGSISMAFTPPVNDGGSPITNYSYAFFSKGGFGPYTEVSPPQTTSPLIINIFLAPGSATMAIKAINAIGSSIASNLTSFTVVAPT